MAISTQLLMLIKNIYMDSILRCCLLPAVNLCTAIIFLPIFIDFRV